MEIKSYHKYFKEYSENLQLNLFHCGWTINTLDMLKVNYKDKNCTYYPSNIDGGKIIGKKQRSCVRRKQILPYGKRLIGNQKDKPKHLCRQ